MINIEMVIESIEQMKFLKWTQEKKKKERAPRHLTHPELWGKIK